MSPTPRTPSPGPAAAGALGVLARTFFYWLPVLVPLALLAQVSLRGLRPALAESRRLDAAEQRLETRVEAHLARRAELESLHQALADPIYRERLRLERGE